MPMLRQEYNGGTTGLDAYWAGVPILSAPAEKVPERGRGTLT